MGTEQLRVLALYECSGALRDAFLRQGCDAYSCDLNPSTSDHPQDVERHYQMDVFEFLSGGLDIETVPGSWDLIVAFPPCTYLAKVQQWMCNRSDARRAKQQAAIETVRRLWALDCHRLAIENPVGRLTKEWREPDQIIQPYYFGDPYQKQTCLWFRGVPPLIFGPYSTGRRRMQNHTNGRMSQAQKSAIKSSWAYFPNTCNAIAYQWATYIENDQ